MEPIVLDKKDDRLVILQRGNGPKFEKLFFLAIQDAVLEGYRVPKEAGGYDTSLRNFRGTNIGRCVMYKEGKEPTFSKPEVKKEEKEVKAPEVEEKKQEVAEENPAEDKPQKKAGRPPKNKK